MVTILLVGVIILLVFDSILLYLIIKRRDTSGIDNIIQRLDNFDKYLNKFESSIRDEFMRNRDELNKSSKDSREEITKSFKNLSESILRTMTEISGLQKNQLEIFSSQLTNLTKLTTDNIQKMINTVDQKLEKMRETIESKLISIQEDNTQKLDKMREIVDEKLHSTIEKRLGESFKLVSERLELVHKGLGEMQSLATGVGDLKKVLMNIKSRGTWGEIQLGALLEQILSREQYSKNVQTKHDSNERVEYAIKLPGRDENNNTVIWLPIDAKFPIEDYQKLIEAQEHGNLSEINESMKQLEASVKREAKNIKEKYIDPPYTTDFAIMFLPIEGLYAEVLRIPGLYEILQREFRVTVTGPTTLAALLNSLQMGFRTLAIEKRSSEVWSLLGAVRTEFSRFGDILEKTQKKLREASDTVEDATKKSRTIERKLKDVQQLPSEKAKELLESTDDR